MSKDGVKKCSKCGMLKDYSCFNKAPSNKDGFRNSCKWCDKKYKREYWQKNKVRLSVRGEKAQEENIFGKKICSKCGKRKNYSEFNKLKINSDGYHGKCKECIRAYKKKHRENNKYKYNASTRKWHHKNSDAINERKRANRDPQYFREYREKHREDLAIKDKAYRRKNRVRLIKFARRRVVEMEDKYIAQLLRLPVVSVPKSLMNLKREHLKLHRALRRIADGKC